jgi:hypothetical protein
MGAWDVDAFGNDSACDWAAQFAETGTLELLAEELEDAASTRGFYRGEAHGAGHGSFQGPWRRRDPVRTARSTPMPAATPLSGGARIDACVTRE